MSIQLLKQFRFIYNNLLRGELLEIKKHVINQNLGGKKTLLPNQVRLFVTKQKLEDNFLRLNNEESTNTSKTKCFFKSKHAYICKKNKENPRLLWLLGLKSSSTSVHVPDESHPIEWSLFPANEVNISFSPPPPHQSHAQHRQMHSLSFLFFFLLDLSLTLPAQIL